MYSIDLLFEYNIDMIRPHTGAENWHHSGLSASMCSRLGRSCNQYPRVVQCVLSRRCLPESHLQRQAQAQAAGVIAECLLHATCHTTCETHLMSWEWPQFLSKHEHHYLVDEGSWRPRGPSFSTHRIQTDLVSCPEHFPREIALSRFCTVWLLSCHQSPGFVTFFQKQTLPARLLCSVSFPWVCCKLESDPTFHLYLTARWRHLGSWLTHP